MKASAISVRLADFLREYPPFEYMEAEVLRELASGGKVRFHEDGEIIFSQGQPRDRWLYVIQQGTVRVIEEDGGREELIDLRGAGDILGLQGIRSEEPYLHTCKTETEVILYALPRAAFAEAAARVPEARRYLAATFSLGVAYQWREEAEEEREGGLGAGVGKLPVTLRKGGLWEVGRPQELARAHLVTVMGDCAVGEVARRLRSKRIDCVLVIDEGGRAIGKVTDADLRDRLVDGSLHPYQPVREVMWRDLVAVSEAADTAELLMKMTRHGKHFLVVTKDGRLDSPVVGCVSERNLFLQYGRFPTVMGEALSSAPDIGSLRSLRDRMEAVVLEFLEGREALSWLMKLAGVFNRTLTARVVELSVEQLVQEGLGEAPLAFSWLMMGSGGRDELTIRSAVYHALVYEDPEPGEAVRAERYFRELARRIASGIRQCGFLESPQRVLAQESGWCLPIGEMEERFRWMLRDPHGAHVYSARDAFDFQPALGEECALAGRLRGAIEAGLAENSGFIRHMARDSLLNQPPRTLFRGYVVDGQGVQREELAIKHHALLPLVDVARVLELEAGSARSVSTYERLRAAAERCGEEETEWAELLRESAEAFMVAQYARVWYGLTHGSDGAVIRPGELSAEIRTLLVTAFRTIGRLLEGTAERMQVDWRKE